MAKKPETTEKKKASDLLKKRVDVAKGKTLGRDVKAPKWLRSFGGYFKGAWDELRQVRWPNRRASWSLTVAVIVFTLAFVAFIVVIDLGFSQLFKQVIL